MISTNDRDVILSKIKEVYDSKYNEVKNTLAEKNGSIFPLSRKYKMETNRRINVWMIVFIILFSGVLGGFARTKYSLLEDLLKIINEARNTGQEAHEASKKQVHGKESSGGKEMIESFKFGVEEFNTRMEKLEKEAKNLKKIPP